jgi:hypothetical protein
MLYPNDDIKASVQLRRGCYLLVFIPEAAQSNMDAPIFAGTLRMSNGESGLCVSADLYSFANREELSSREPRVAFDKDGHPILEKAQGVPVFRREDYRYYLQSIKIVTQADHQTLFELQVRRYEPALRKLVQGSIVNVVLDSKPDDLERFEGPLCLGAERRGRFYAQWISQSLRRAKLQIVLVQPADAAIRCPGAGAGQEIQNWQKVFGKVGLELELEIRNYPKEPHNIIADGDWTSFGLAHIFEKVKKESSEGAIHPWTYYLFCVSRFEQSQYLGLMFDSEAADVNERPRESAAVAALQEIRLGNETKSCQDAFDGKLYFRTALHEVGHLLNLTHTFSGEGLMNTTDFLLSQMPVVQRNAPRFEPDFTFDERDAQWLRHGPDIALRPGGIARYDSGWQSGQAVKVISVREEPSVSLIISLVQATFPLGAPVRLDYALMNRGKPIAVPSALSLSSGAISGRVIGPDRKPRFFRSAFKCCDTVTTSSQLTLLKSEESLLGSMTLLRGTNGPLFPSPGEYRIQIEVRWDADGITRRVIGEASFIVKEPADPQQRKAAAEILGRPSMMLLVVQGLIDEKGAEALGLALSSPILAPHYYVTALKCYRNKMLLSGSPPSASPFANLVELLTEADRSSIASVTPGDRPAPPIVVTRREADQLKPFLDELGSMRQPIRFEEIASAFNSLIGGRARVGARAAL